MDKLILVLFSFLIVSCATRFILPAQRFLGPEVQGGGLRSSIEMSTSNAHLGKLQGTFDGIKGVSYEEIQRTGYHFATGLFDSFDFIWSHIASGNSLVGAKFQALGSPRGAGDGAKLSFAYFVGGNEHEPSEKDIQFKLNAQEFWAIYGYRLNPMFMPYVSAGFSKYNYKAQVKTGDFQGEKPRIRSDIYSLMLGGELNFEAIFLRLETGMQLLESTKTKDKWTHRTGLSLGYSW